MTFVLANIFQPLIDVLDSVIVFIHDTANLSWGWSIIALTVVVRTLLLPLTVKQFKSMQSLQRVAPQLKELQQKYKDDKQRLQQETMKFYQENKVNPFGSCLPLVAQLPVFLALFYLLREDLRVDICGQEAKPCGEVPPGDWGQEFFFVPDITDAAHGSTLWILIVLYVGSQLLSSLLMPATVDRNQRLIFMALPFFFVPFIISFPAGLIIYWITTNFWTVGQQTILRRQFGHATTEAAEAAKAAPAGAAALTDGKGNGTAKGDGKGKAAPPSAGRAAAKAKASGENGADEKPKARTGAAPPPPPRRKKKRSGRRR